MANLKSAKKRIKQTEKRRLVNLSRKTSFKTAVRKVLDSLKRNDAIDETKKLLREAEAKIARARGKGVLHRNTAIRKISRLAKRVAQAERAPKSAA
jgi:small subunit ribosomal protein S20